METGRIKWFDREKGYGYIYQDSGEEDLYVHINQVKVKNLKTDDIVNYKVGENNRGPCANDVMVI